MDAVVAANPTRTRLAPAGPTRCHVVRIRYVALLYPSTNFLPALPLPPRRATLRLSRARYALTLLYTRHSPFPLHRAQQLLYDGGGGLRQ